MNISQMKQVLAEILTRTDLTPCVVGHRGVGKSAGIVQVCREIGRDYVALRLGQMEVGDLVGIPYREGQVMHWSRPSWWPADDAPETIIHCDELNRAQQEDTLQAIFQFVEPPVEKQSRRLHTHVMHPKHKVVVSINPPDGSYQVATLDRALLDRMVMIYVETDYNCWARFAREQQFDDGVQQFLAAYPNLLARPGAPMDMQMEPTERAWEMVSKLRHACRFSADLEMEVYAGIVGQEAAVSFLRWSREQKERPVTARQVLDRWAEVAGRVNEQRDDLQAVTLNDLVTTLEVDPALTTEQERNLVSYIGALPRDLRFGLVKSLVKIPRVADVLCKDDYDDIILEAIAAISREAS
jgi:MoxR-like ATPase